MIKRSSTEEFVEWLNNLNTQIAENEAKKVKKVDAEPDPIRLQRENERRTQFGKQRTRSNRSSNT